MKAASIFRRSADESIAHLRSLFPTAPGMARPRTLPPSLVNWEICEPILDKLNLAAYKRTTIIDMNPGLGIFSAALHERLKPKQHILLEPEEKFGDSMREFQETYKNSWYVPLDGYNWDTYSELFSKDPLPPPWPDKFPKPEIKTSPSSEGVNADLLFVGQMGKSIRSERLISQFISCCALGTWVQRYGRVRFLLWVTDSIKDRYLPRSIAARARPAATAEAIVDITEVATSDEIRTGKGFHKLPVITQDNVHLEEKKPAPSKRQEIKSEIREEIKLNIKPKLVEDEIKKLVAEELGLPKTRGRPKNLPDKQQKELEKKKKKATAKVRKIVEAIRDGNQPKLPTRLSSEERVRLLDRYDEIRRAFGHKTKAEVAAKILQKEEDRQRRKEGVPRNPGRPRRLPPTDQPATTAELEAIEERIMKNPELWVEGMEHPPWYYQGNKEELRKFVVKLATMRPALRVDPKAMLQPENLYSTMIEEIEEGGGLPERTATGEEPSTTSASVRKEGKSAAQAWEEYEEQWSRRSGVKAQEQGREDQIYAVRNRLLKIYDRPYEPLRVDPKGDFFPHIPMTLLELVPKVPHPFFSAPTSREREKNWLTFEWLLRNLFVLRANSVSSALRSLAPGAENILADLPANQRIQPTRRVRCLRADDLVNLTRAWAKWPFKNPGIQFERYSGRDLRGTKLSVY
ncbi:ribosomal RNA adenine dimethylase-domain-containing protein [Tuber borchii]|uniref:rRNA adenine N(6)-methyltransferase n=1 Tax=Tuber borchii TaxID=42251 RepID=A0A2T7A761_TUBBO|nr:ribosomal RNA adenine dimethylase-domain-containing protein [Tuber borchii]